MNKSGERKYVKRKKFHNPRPNPLFEEWLQEWKDDAAKKGYKAQYIYQKALNTLKKYPLTLRSGKEAIFLENFGEKICQMLDDRLAKHYAEHGVPEPVPDELETSSCSEEPTRSQSNNKNTTSKTSKQYVPVPGSGPHALIVALYRNLENGHTEWMRKTELIEAAQPYCNKSFTVPDPGSFYTAWNSIKTLQSKGCVNKQSHPPKYSLTDFGVQLACRLLNVGTANDARAAGDVMGRSSNGMRAASKVTEPSAKYSTGTPPAKKKRTSRPGRKSQKSNPRGNKLRGGAVHEISDDETIPVPGLGVNGISVANAIAPIKPWAGTTAPMPDTSTSAPVLPVPRIPAPIVPFPRISPPTVPVPSTSAALPTSQFVLSPGQFKVLLCVDNCEATGGAATINRKDTILQDLRNNGVDYDLRKLHVGDFVWVVQEKVQFVPGQLRISKPRELVLDIVMERKRMDDLAGSIKDGRFHEQKFRLKSCGLKRLFYLVEDYGSGNNLRFPKSTLEQAISNTQIVDGFTVKRTSDLRESVAFLTLMTRCLQKQYSGRILQSCSREQYLDLPLDVTTDQGLLMTFDEFNSSSVKNRALTVTELFSKQLVQLHGLTPEKATAITTLYPTVQCLREAFQSCDSTQNREKLLENIKFGKGIRSLGAAISKTLYQLYCLDNFPKS